MDILDVFDVVAPVFGVSVLAGLGGLAATGIVSAINDSKCERTQDYLVQQAIQNNAPEGTRIPFRVKGIFFSEKGDLVITTKLEDAPVKMDDTTTAVHTTVIENIYIDNGIGGFKDGGSQCIHGIRTIKTTDAAPVRPSADNQSATPAAPGQG